MNEETLTKYFQAVVNQYRLVDTTKAGDKLGLADINRLLKIFHDNKNILDEEVEKNREEAFSDGMYYERNSQIPQ